MTDTTVQSLEEMAAQLAVLSAAVAKLTITVSGVLTEKKYTGPLSIIVEEVAVHTGIRVEHIRGVRRKTDYVQARWTAIYIAARLTGYSLTRLAAFFRKDHTRSARDPWSRGMEGMRRPSLCPRHGADDASGASGPRSGGGGLMLQMRRHALYAKIEIARKELGLDDADFRAVMETRFGARSRKDLSDAQLVELVEHFKACGFKRERHRKNAAVRSRRREQAKMRALWLSLWHLGEITDATRKPLRASRGASRRRGRRHRGAAVGEGRRCLCGDRGAQGPP